MADIELPFTPKQDDVKLEFSESERILEIRLNRHAKLDDDAARKLTIKPKQKVTADEKTEHQTEVAAKPSDTLEANEKTLMAKFRAAASVTSAFGAEEAGKNADAKVENTTTQEAGEAEATLEPSVASSGEPGAGRKGIEQRHLEMSPRTVADVPPVERIVRGKQVHACTYIHINID